MTTEKEKKLLEEINFWVEYIQTWSKHSTEPVPQAAIDSLDNAILLLKQFYINQEISQVKKNKTLH